MARTKKQLSRRQLQEQTERPSFPLFYWLHEYLENRTIYLFLLVTGCIIFAVFRDFLLLKNVYLFKDIGSDSINGNWPQIVHIINYLKNDGIPKWTFNQGMGQPVLGVLTFDPFLILFYLVGSGRVAYALAYVEALKIILGGLFFFLYLRTLRVSNYAALIGGLLYSFTAYMILGGGWYFFSYDAVCISLLLYGFEKLFRQNVWYVLPLPIALMASYQPYQVYLYSVLLLFYAATRCVEEKGWVPKYFCLFLLRLVPPILLGLGLSSVFLFTSIAQILQSSRVEGETSYFHTLVSQPVFALAPPIQYVSDVLRLFSSDLIGTANNFKGWSNYLESPMFYSGLVVLLLAPQVFVFIDQKRRVLYAIVAGLCVTTLIFPYFRYAAWLFSGNYFRTFSFFITLPLLYFAVCGLSYIDRRRKISLPVLIISLLGSLAVLYIPTAYYDQYVVVSRNLRLIVTSFLILYTALLTGVVSKRYGDVVKSAILLLVAIESGYLSYLTVNHREVLSSKELSARVGYNDYTKEAIAFVDSHDGSFFRVNKDYASGPAMHGSLNDGEMQGYRGTTSYHSFNQKYYLRFLEAADIIRPGDESGTRWAVGTVSRPLLEALTSVKYNLTKREDLNPFGPLYEHLADFKDVHVYRNQYSLPLGFCYDSYLSAAQFARLSPSQKDQALLKAFVAEDRDTEQFAEFKVFDPATLESEYRLAAFQRDIFARQEAGLAIDYHGQNQIRGTVKVDEKRLMFFSIPYDPGWSARVDGGKAPLFIVNAGFLGLVLPKGTHTVELTFQPVYLVAGAGASLLSIIVYGLLLYRRRVQSSDHE